MYCAQCGKQLKDNMLFCPYCGTPVANLDAEKPANEVKRAPAGDDKIENLFDVAEERLVFPDAPVKKSVPETKSEVRVVSLFDEYDNLDIPDDDDQEEFRPLNVDDIDAEIASLAEEADIAAEHEEAQAVDIEIDLPANQSVKRREGTVIQTPESARERSKKTFIPVQDVDPDNIFMDEPDDLDDYDAYDEQPVYSAKADRKDDYEYEDRIEGSFFRRHIRGIVGLILLVMLAAICLIWASTTKGQTVLAKMNLAWHADVYAELGYEAYQSNDDLQAARYYEKAYSRDIGNYTYAHSAMVAYYEADKLENATSMLKICVELQPNNPEPYSEFLILYPEDINRPWEITEIIREGYQRTGDERLNIG